MVDMDSVRADTAAREIPRLSPLRRIQHFRLAAWFVGTALVGLLAGVLTLEVANHHLSKGAAHWALMAAGMTTAVLGFAGVLIHRLRVLPLRWQETRSYLIAIQRESEKYRLLLEGAADMLVLVDPESGELLEWNARAREGLGLPAMAARRPALGTKSAGESSASSAGLPLSIDQLVTAQDCAILRAALAAADAGADATPLGELLLECGEGRRRVADARLATIELEGSRVVLLALRDVTHQKKIEKELVVRERLASIGLLTAGVAHEINNPLEGITNYLRLASRSGLSEETRAESLDQVRYGLDRIRNIVKDLLSFTRPGTEARATDLAIAVKRAAKLTAYSESMKSMTVEFVGLDRPLDVMGDPGRLEQVVFNLLLNAANAMGHRGRITVRASSAATLRGAASISLSVEDEGPGIPAEHMDRLFDPFFTTSEGAGLGLSVSYGIVRAHGGQLSAANRPTGGAVFTVTLPQMEVHGA
ncbi:MAG: hypothetical protein H6828_06815 [Planctomycetes bacterium]|nr:hypothetical protein [Planctomycetota bacterium]